MVAVVASTVFATMVPSTVADAEPAFNGTRYSGTEFKTLFDLLEPLPNSSRISSPPPIRGHGGADARIRSIATSRGYRLRSVHNGARSTAAGVPMDRRAAGALQELINFASRSGHRLGASYGFRSVDLQRTLFLRRISGYSNATIARGGADGAINAALMWVAAPGYSKHHTGYAVDLQAAGGATFGTSAVGRWLAADNYAVAKRFGFVPSYPPGAGRQGPEPEPWEFVYVGTSAINCGRRLLAGDRASYNACVSGSSIEAKYQALGGERGWLGRRTVTERAIAPGRGRYAGYQNGNIYWAPKVGAHEVHGGLLTEYRRAGGVEALGYPLTDTRTSSDGRWRYNNLERGRLYYARHGGATFTVAEPFFAKHEGLMGIHGPLGYPVSQRRGSRDGRSTYQNFSKGRIYLRSRRVNEIRGAVYTWHETPAVGGVAGSYGYPTSDLVPQKDRRGSVQMFEGGWVWNSNAFNARGLQGDVLRRYLINGAQGGYLGYPKGSVRPVDDQSGSWASFEHGHIYGTESRGAHQVHGAVLDAYLGIGGPQGALGYPTSELEAVGSPHRVQTFEFGIISYSRDGAKIALYDR